MNSPEIQFQLQILSKYREELDYLFAVSVEGGSGFRMYAERIRSSVEDGSTSLENNIFYSSQSPNDPDASYQHRAKISEVIDRNHRNAKNTQTLYRALIVFAYMQWEDRTRIDLAKFTRSR